MKTLIVDDERPARDRLKRILARDPRIEVIGEADCGESAIVQIEERQPELIFLDIQMPGMTGFDVLRLLNEDHRPPKVVFVTAHDEYAVAAFEHAAADYLLKPYSESRLTQAIDRVLAQSANSPAEVLPELHKLHALHPQPYIRRLPVRSLQRIILLDVATIAYVVSEHRVNHVYTDEADRYWTPESLDALSQRLDPEMFFRIHRSTLINLTAKFQIEPWEDGRLRLHFNGGVTLIAARDPAQRLRAKLGF